MNVSEICRYCGGKVKLASASEIHEQGDDKIYLCTNCNAWVSCHKGTSRPMGKLANAALRMKRRETHQKFDKWWQSHGMTRTQAYKWLARQMGLSPNQAHIAQFEMDACEQVIKLCWDNKNNKEAA